MTEAATISFQLERALALADCGPKEHPDSLIRRRQDLAALLPRLRTDMDLALARQEKNGHPKARRIARYFDDIQGMFSSETTLLKIYQKLSLIDDDWQFLTD